jgi:hypothetical protein
MQRQKFEKFDKDRNFVIDFTDPGGVLFIAKIVSALPAAFVSPREPKAP